MNGKVNGYDAAALYSFIFIPDEMRMFIMSKVLTIGEAMGLDC